MIILSMRKKLLAIILAGALAGVIPGLGTAQNCGCAPNLCCSKYYYCGSNSEYCGADCRAGPCNPPNGVSVPDIVTDAFFSGIANQAGSGCPGKGFFTRAAFVEALKSYPKFGRVGSVDDSKREIAAFFAHATLETDHFCYIEERGGESKDYCDPNNKQYPCVPNNLYYGRGPLQLSWNYNYGPAGQSIGFDGLKNPDIVAKDSVISFKASLWFWMNDAHYNINTGKGFGETIRLINGAGECNGGNSNAVGERVRYYTDYCNKLGVSPGDNLRC